MNDNTSSVKSSLGCPRCGRIIYGDVPCNCDTGLILPEFTFSGPVLGNAIAQKLDRIIELLEKLSDEDGDKILVKSGILKDILDEAKTSSSPPSSDWQKELDSL